MYTVNIIVKELERNKKTSQELCEFLKIETSVFDSWVSGESESYTEYLPLIAKFLGVSKYYLVGRFDKKNPFDYYGEKITYDTLTDEEKLALEKFRDFSDKEKTRMLQYLMAVYAEIKKGEIEAAKKKSK